MRPPRGAGLLAAVLVLTSTSCGLRYPQGVRQPGSIPVGQGDPGPVQVLPPGPQPDASPDQVVLGFMDAQTDPAGGHAIARSFLAADRRAGWRDEAGVEVYDPFSRRVVLGETDPSTVVVTADLVGHLDPKGSYTPYDPGTQHLRDVYRLRRDGTSWSLTDVPPGLRLSPADRDRSFRVRNVYYLAHSYGQTSETPHLVADPVFLASSADPAPALVTRLLAGWSDQLSGGAVGTAVPAGTTLARPVRTENGTVTVELATPGCHPAGRGLQDLSAQLVWTLRGVGPSFERLALRCGGRPLSPAGLGPLQDRTAWDGYDPDGLAGRAPAYYLDHRALRTLDGVAATGPVSDGRQPVDEAALSPGRSLGIITTEGARSVVRTGSLRGPYQLRFRGTGLTSPSWGSGEQGLWFLATGARSDLMLAPNRVDSPAFAVPVEGAGRLGQLRAMRVSRDGARIALVAGPATDARLYVGRVQPGGPGGVEVEVAGLRAAAPGLHDVREVAWESGTSLVALGRVGAVGPLPVRVAVDGSSSARVVRQGLEQLALTSVAAAPDRPLTLGVVAGGGPRVFRDNAGVFVDQGPGRAPFYPG